MQKTTIIAIVILGLVLAAIYLSSTFDVRDNTTVVLASTGRTGPFSLLYANGAERGIYEKYGLNITYTTYNDAYTGMLSLLTGSIDSMSTSPGIAISAHFEDGNLSIGMAIGLASNLMLIVKPGYTDLLTLKGKRFGVIGTNSDSYRIIKSYLKTKGLDIETDVDLIEIKKPANLLTSFQTDQLDAVVLMSGYAVEAIKSGGEAIITITDAAEELFGCPAYSTTMLVSDKFLERGKLVDKFLRAQREIAREIEKDPEGAIQIHADFAGEDPEKMRDIFEIITLVCDINPEIEQNIIKYTEYGKSQGFFEEAIGEEIFYDDWA